MSNDQRRNVNNLLFRPNISIDDEQPAFYFYSQSQAPPQQPPNTRNTTPTGPNNNPYQPPNINFSNLYNPETFNNNQKKSQTQPPRLFPAQGLQSKPQPPEPVPSVILFSNTTPVPTTTESAIQYNTISTCSTTGPPLPLFNPTEIVPKVTPVEPSHRIPLFNAGVLPPNSGASFFDSVGTPTKSKGSEIAQTASVISQGPDPIVTTESLPTVPLYSPGDIPVKPTQVGLPQTGSTNTYRRTGSKRPVYAPIPGLQDCTKVNNQFEPQQSVADYFSSTTTQLAPQHFSSQSIYSAPTGQSITSVQGNSPFLSPVVVPSALACGEDLISSPVTGSIMPAMTTGSSQMPTASSVMYPNGGRLSPVVGTVTAGYNPPNYHWFYKKELDGKGTWEPFSYNDSLSLERNFTSPDLTPEKNIPTDGGRFDVNILRRQRTSVYWDSKPAEVRRCSWFHKSHTDSKNVPFEENVATKLEEEYKSAVESNQWPKKVNLPSGETIMFHTHDVLVLFSNSQITSVIDNNMESQSRPRVVKRGFDDCTIEEGESEKIDHLLFMVHGIGAGCDLKFRSVEEVVDDFRSVALQLIGTHYRSSCDRKIVNRVEILPISWHHKLHSEDTGIDNKLKSITLESIPKLREFTNDTLLDILFYTSPIYGQTIISSVGGELNRIYDLFKQRNPNFSGGISLAGHSLGSLILFDILCHQVPVLPDIQQDSDEDSSLVEAKPHPSSRKMSRRVSYMVGSGGTGQAQVNYPILNFQPVTFFALGSPIGMFVTIRGLDNLGEKFAFPTCPAFFNIFHPYDPVAYRIESLINPQLANVKPVLIPHHKGRKRMHLELKETMAKVGSDLKQKLVDSMKNTWNSLVGWSNTNQQPPIAEEVDKVLEQFASKHSERKEGDSQATATATGMNLGMLNRGRRIDYVLQEAPVEFFNEYIFALSSHVCYWDSEDTVLLIVKEIYSLLNISPDCQIPQQSMTIERPPSSSRTPDQFSSSPVQLGMDPTMPIKKEGTIGPPPLSGFVKH